MNISSVFRAGTGVTQILIVLVVIAASGCTKTSNPTGTAANLSDPSIKPAVIFTLPADGGIGPFDVYNVGNGSEKPSFVVQFNKLMSIYSINTTTVSCAGFDVPVVAAFHGSAVIFPYDQSHSYNSGSGNDNAGHSPRLSKQTNSNYDDVLGFDILDSMTHSRMTYAVGKTYTVTIDTTIQDINGNHLQRPCTFSFTPEPSFRVVDSYPVDNQKDVVAADAQNILLVFNSPLTTDVLPQIQINPSLDGSWQLFAFSSDSMRVVFSSTENFDYNTAYSIRVPGTMTDRFGHTLSKDYTASFHTAMFQVAGVNPLSGSTNAPISDMNIFMTGPVDQSTLHSSFSITPNVDGVVLSSAETIRFIPTNGFDYGIKYTVTLSPTLKASDGTALSSTYSTNFTTMPFQLTGTNPPDGAINWSAEQGIEVYFNGTVDGTTLKNAFTITPNVAGYFSNYENSSFYFLFWPTPGFAMNTKYTVTISTALKSSNGCNLSGAYNFSFSTAPFQVTFIYPSDGTWGVSRTNDVQIGCNASLDTATIHSAFSISPPVAGELLYDNQSTGFSFSPNNPFAANTSYTVTVSKSLKAFDGTALSKDYNSTFVTGQ